MTTREPHARPRFALRLAFRDAARRAVAWVGMAAAAWAVLLALEPLLKRDVGAITGWSGVQVASDAFVWSVLASEALYCAALAAEGAAPRVVAPD